MIQRPHNLKSTQEFGLITDEPDVQRLYKEVYGIDQLKDVFYQHTFKTLNLLGFYNSVYQLLEGDSEARIKQFSEKIRKEYENRGETVLSIEAHDNLTGSIKIAGLLREHSNSGIFYDGEIDIGSETLRLCLTNFNSRLKTEVSDFYSQKDIKFDPHTEISFSARCLGFSNMPELEKILYGTKQKLNKKGITSKLFFCNAPPNSVISLEEA
ncbi:MAG: hypothetical protein KJ559_03980 [Nanoarchaeota archaeon]|nr:hypothetical protein [Nanoarchaeota archaeon]